MFCRYAKLFLCTIQKTLSCKQQYVNNRVRTLTLLALYIITICLHEDAKHGVFNLFCPNKQNYAACYCSTDNIALCYR